MRRVYALVISLALLAVTPGLATADPLVRPARNQQAVDFVIARALAQRGVAYSYGGGNAAGPSLGSGSSSDSSTGIIATEQRANTFGAEPGTSLFGNPGGTILGTVPAPAVVGFDSSGLIVYAFAGAGLKLPRSSGDQFAAAQKVLPAQALPGDLIFYGPNGTQSVALFLGNGQMLEATDPVVEVSPVRTNGMTPYLARIIA